MKVMVVSGGYLPGFRYGGPVRSLSALVAQLGDEIDFSIVTTDRDLGTVEPYPGIEPNTWHPVGKARVCYSTSRRMSLAFWKRVLASEQPDVVYLNSFFAADSISFLIWRRLRLIKSVPVVLSPRGEFSPGALRLKWRKKALFMRMSSAFGLHTGMVWQASAAEEQEEILEAVGGDALILVAPVLRAASASDSSTAEQGGHYLEDGSPKLVGEARFVWIARITPKKNLVGAIAALADVQGNAELTVYGPIEDRAYWDRCVRYASQLPANVRFRYGGELIHNDVAAALSGHQYLLFPTLGENFGHIIAEALDRGLPVLVSDQTPWRDLEASGVGWDIGLDRTDQWREAIRSCIEMSDAEYQAMGAQCRNYVARWIEERGGREASLRLFQMAMAKGCAR